MYLVFNTIRANPSHEINRAHALDPDLLEPGDKCVVWNVFQKLYALRFKDSPLFRRHDPFKLEQKETVCRSLGSKGLVGGRRSVGSRLGDNSFVTQMDSFGLGLKVEREEKGCDEAAALDQRTTGIHPLFILRLLPKGKFLVDPLVETPIEQTVVLGV